MAFQHLYDKHLEKDEKFSCRITETIILSSDPLIGVTLLGANNVNSDGSVLLFDKRTFNFLQSCLLFSFFHHASFSLYTSEKTTS